MEKLEKIILSISAILFIVFIILLIIIFIDFRNDYKCSTTNDPDYFIKHNCIRYFR